MTSVRRRLADRAASGAIWASAQNWGNQIVRVVVFLVLARLLGPEAFGLLAMALVVTVLGETLIVEGGWSEALIRNRQLRQADLNSVFWFLSVASLLFLGLAIVLADTVAVWFAEPALAQILPWIACVLPLHALNVVPRAMLQREFDFRPIALASLGGTLGGGMTAVVLALAGAGIWSLVVYQLVQSLIWTVLLWRVCPWSPGREFDLTSLRHTMRFASGVLVERLSRSVDFIVGRSFIGHEVGTLALGYYGFAFELLGLTRRLLVVPMTRVALPAIVNLHAEPERLRVALLNGLQFLALFAFPAPIALAMVAPDLVPLLVGSQWRPAVPAVQIAMLLGPIVPLLRLSVTLQMGLGHARNVAALAIGATALFLVLLHVPQTISVNVVLTALVARSYLMLPLHFALIRRATTIGLIDLLRVLGPIVLACGMMAAAVLAARFLLPADLVPLGRLVASMVVGLAVYFAALWMMSRSLLHEAIRLAAGALGVGRGRTDGVS